MHHIDLPSYHPGFRTNLITFDCDLGSAKNTLWDGAYTDKIIINKGLCWVNLADEGGSGKLAYLKPLEGKTVHAERRTIEFKR